MSQRNVCPIGRHNMISSLLDSPDSNNLKTAMIFQKEQNQLAL